MKEFRKDKNCTEHYSSLEELRAAYGMTPVLRRTKDKKRLKSQQEKFLGTCKVCKKELSLIKNTNVLACQNPDCKGICMTSTNDDGSERAWYIPVTKVLDVKGTQIAENLFD